MMARFIAKEEIMEEITFVRTIPINGNPEFKSNGCSGKCENAAHSKGVYSSNLINSGSCASATTCNSPTS